MREYVPDTWVLVRISSPEHGIVYKILASWYGGFASGDSWKLSSGIESVRAFESEGREMFELPQSSGSVYICSEGNRHLSGICASVFSSFIRDIEESSSLITMEIVDHDLRTLNLES